MKWRSPTQGWRANRAERTKLMKKWHRSFAVRPHFIKEADYEGIKVPAHWVWFEYVDRREHGGFTVAPLLVPLVMLVCAISPVEQFEYRPYTGTEPINKCNASPSEKSPATSAVPSLMSVRLWATELSRRFESDLRS